METKHIIAIAIAIAVGAITMSTVLVPAVSMGTDTEDTFTNKGRYYVTTEIEDEVTIIMNYDIENNVRSWYIDNVLLEYDNITGPEYVSKPTVAGTDNYVFRTDGRYRGLNSSTGSADYALTVTKDSITKGDFVGNAPLFIASTEKTNSIMRYSPDTDSYVLGDSRIVAAGYTDIKLSDDNQTNVVITIDGTIEDGVTITTFNTDYSFTVSNTVINAEKVSGYNNLYKYQSVTFDVTYNDGTTDYVTPCTYSMVVLPAEVAAEKSIHASAPVIQIFNMLPIFVALGLIVTVIGVAYVKYRR